MQINPTYPDLGLTPNDIPSSPWGAVQHVQEIAAGIVMVSTSSHGGIKVSDARFALMPKAFRQTAYSAGGWFEEDADWALVALCFPLAFKPEDVATAKRIVERTHPELMGPLNDMVTDAILNLQRQEPSAERNAALKAHRDILPVKVAS